MTLYSFCRLFLLFFYYSFLGYIVETIFVSISQGKLNLNRGFCVGPYIPIYGIGSLLIVLFIEPNVSNPFLVFILSLVVCTLVEYIISFVAEFFFKTRLWNYKKYKYNINGRVCLKNSLYFGIGGIFVVYVLNPLFNKLLDLYSEKFLIISSIICIVVFVIDLGLSIFVAIRFSKKVARLKDSTIFINKERKLMSTRFEKNFIGRLLKGFPILKESLNTNFWDKISIFNKNK